jgi:aspartate-semialdehyde dehydrogenase
MELLMLQNLSASVVVLGATGMVGQRAVSLLQGHPWLRLVGVAASARSTGKKYSDACRWALASEPYGGQGDKMVKLCAPASFQDVSGVKIAISALPSETASHVELAFAAAGWIVVSNASAHRMVSTVPLVIPEVNGEHLNATRLADGGIITNPNCTAVPLTVSLAALQKRTPIEAVTVASYQAVSGAGYPGESAFDMIGNVRPHPGDEEEKLAMEPAKMLGEWNGTAFTPASFSVSARCVRVPVVDGHLVAVHVRTKEAISVEEAQSLFRGFHSSICAELPSSPTPLIQIRAERDRPQPRLDAMYGGGMGITVGRIEVCPVMGLKYFALAHNTLRGAAGAAILNAELALVSLMKG